MTSKLNKCTNTYGQSVCRVCYILICKGQGQSVCTHFPSLLRKFLGLFRSFLSRAFESSFHTHSNLSHAFEPFTIYIIRVLIYNPFVSSCNSLRRYAWMLVCCRVFFLKRKHGVGVNASTSACGQVCVGVRVFVSDGLIVCVCE